MIAPAPAGQAAGGCGSVREVSVGRGCIPTVGSGQGVASGRATGRAALAPGLVRQPRHRPGSRTGTRRPAGCWPTSRPAAGDRRAGHRQDHAAAGRGGRPGSAAGADPDAHAAAGRQPAGRGGAAGAAGRAAARRRGRSAGAPLREPLVRTVHSYAFGVLRLHAARNGDPPPRLLASAEQDAVVRDLLAGELRRGGSRLGLAGAAAAGASGCPASPPSCASCCCAPPSAGSGPDELTELGQRHGVPEWAAAGPVLPQLRARRSCCAGPAGRGAPQATAPALDAAELVAAALDALAADPELLAAERERVRHLRRRRRPGPRPAADGAGPGARRHGAETVLLAGDPDQAVLNFRGADPEGLRRRRGRDGACCARRPPQRARGPRGRARGSRPGCREPGPAGSGPARPASAARAGRHGAGAGVRLGRAGGRLGGRPAAPRPPHRTACRGRGWRCWSAPPAARCRRCAGRCWPPGCRSPRRPTSCRWPASPRWCRCCWCCGCATRPDELDADAATALLTSPLGSADPMRMRRLRRGLLRLHAAGGPRRADGPRGPADAERVGSDPLLVEALRAAARGRPDPLAALPAHETAPLRRVGALLAIAGDGGARRGERRGGALAGLAGQRAGPAVERGQRARRPGRAPPPTATSTPCSRCSTRPPGTPTGCPAPTSAGFTDYLADQQLPGDSLAAARPAGRGGRAAHRARRARPRVGRGRRARRAGGQLAGPAAARQPAGHRAAGRPGGRGRRAGRATVSRVGAAAGRGAAAVLRGLHPGPAHAAGQRRAGRGRAALPVPRRARPGAGRRRPTAPVHRPGRALVLAELVGELRRAVCEPDRRRSPAARAAGGAGAAAAAAGPAGRRPACRARTRTTGTGCPGVHRRAAARAGRAGAGVAVGRREDHPLPAALGAGAARRRRRWARWPRSPARWCTRWCRPSAAGADGAELEGALRSAWSRLDAGRALVRPPRAGAGARDAGRVRRLGAVQPGRGAAAGGRRAAGAARPARPELDGPPARRPWLRLRGRVDRLEVDADGRPVVVDVKTGKTAVSARAAAEHPQLPSTSSPRRSARSASCSSPARRPGGARLVYLADQKAGGQAKEPVQPPLDEAELARWEGVVRRLRRGDLRRDVHRPGRPGLRPLPGADQLPGQRGRPRGPRTLIRHPAPDPGRPLPGCPQVPVGARCGRRCTSRTIARRALPLARHAGSSRPRGRPARIPRAATVSRRGRAEAAWYERRRQQVAGG